MGVVIAYCKEPDIGIPALRADDTSYWNLPDSTKRDDVAVLYAGAGVNAYVGTERITSDWKGPPSRQYIETDGLHEFSRPVPAREVEAAIGLKRPTRKKPLPDDVGEKLLDFLQRQDARASRGRGGAPTSTRQARREKAETAIEGILTESRRTNRSRNPKLQKMKLACAKGTCEGCGVDYSKLKGVVGTRVLTVHHRKQMSAFEEPHETKLADLAVLCANCHMLVHTDPKRAMSVEELARKLRTAGRKAKPRSH